MNRRNNSREIIWLWLCTLGLILFLTLAVGGAGISPPMVPLVLIVSYLIMLYLMKSTWEYGRVRAHSENSPEKTSREMIGSKRSRPTVSIARHLHGNSVFREPPGSHLISQS
jgi:hypothetical protein